MDIQIDDMIQLADPHPPGYRYFFEAMVGAGRIRVRGSRSIVVKLSLVLSINEIPIDLWRLTH